MVRLLALATIATALLEQKPLAGFQSRTSTAFCEEYAIQFPGIVSFPRDSEYEAEQASYFSIFQSQLQPACRLTPGTENELRDIYRDLVAGSIPFAVRAGGHSWNTFSNINSSGVTIDLSALDNIDLDQEKQTVKLGAGLKWRQVYDYLESYNLTAPGGRDADVGVSGFLLGGGLSWNANRLGWSMDAIVSMRILIPSGEIVTADRSNHSELFWATKGSGGVLGIVTEYELPVLKQDEFYGSVISFDSDQIDAAVDAVIDLASHEEDHPNDIAYIGGGHVGRSTEVVWNTIMVNLDNRTISPALQRIDSLPCQGKLNGVWAPGSFAENMHKSNPVGFRQAKSTFTYRMSASTTKKIMRLFTTAMRGLQLDAADSWIAVGFQPLTRSHIYHDKSNIFDLASVLNEPLMLFSLEARWREEGSDNRMNIECLHKKLEDVAGDDLVRYQYANYANAKWQDPLASYGEATTSRLRAVAKRYDPNEIFTGYAALRKGSWKIDLSA